MKKIIKSFLAAIGAFFVVIILFSIFIALIFGNDDTPRFGDKVAIVEIQGVILDSTSVIRELQAYAKRDDVKAVILRINSPGGSVGPSQEIYSEVKRLREKKRVVASMGSVAASGGYYIAAAADKIVANPGTITGSIGVIIEFLNTEELFKKLGLKGFVIKSGKFKDTGSPMRELTEEDRELMQGVVDDVHSQFVMAIAEGRGMKVEDVSAYADGRIFSGAQALTLGFVDSLGSLSDAIDLSAELAGLSGEPKVIYPKKPTGLLGRLFDEDASALISELFMGLKVMYLLPDLSGSAS